jgi:hypothetical protein
VALARVGAVVLTVAGAVACVTAVTPLGTVLFLSYAGIGTYLVVRRPGNSIGWLLMLVAWGLAMGSVQIPAGLGELESGGLDPVDAALTWSYGIGWWFAMLGLLGMALVFPSGRLPQGRWRRAGIAAIAAMGVIGVPMAIGPRIQVLPAGSTIESVVPNPYAVPGMPDIGQNELYYLMSIAVVFGIVGMLVRFRRSTGLERIQYRWLVAGVVVVAVGTAVWVVATQLLGLPDHGLAALAIVAATYPALPAAIAVAVLRYRLYEIDRIISRSLSYAVVTGILVVAFGGTVIVLQAALAGVTQGATLAVAASTLLAASLLQPVRRRVQSAIDRRFDRSRYDSVQLGATFSNRLRGEVDLSAVTAELRGAVHLGLSPSRTGIWLRDPRRTP